MNIILFEPGELRDGRLRLTDRRASHIASVIAPAAGDELRVGLIAGGAGRARVASIGDGVVELVEIELGLAPEPPPCTLLLAVPRPKSVPRIVSAAASLGVAAIHLSNAWRVDKSYLAATAVSESALARAARLGCEQGGHTWVPPVRLHPRLMPLLDDLPPTDRRLLAHPRAPVAIENVELAGSTLLAVGPERGWIDRELESFEERGFVSIRAIDAVMRTETAVPVLLGQLALLRRVASG